MIEINKVHCMDCLEGMKLIEDKSIDLVLTDPPYNIGVGNEKWDRWEKQAEYINWLGSVFIEYQRVLKENGSFYFFHNDYLQIVQLQNFINKNTDFKFRSLITWNKGSFRGIGWINPGENNTLRSWFNTQEYALYYTFQDGSGLKNIYSNRDCFRPIKDYLISEKKKAGLKVSSLHALLGNYMYRHYFEESQWSLPTEKSYKKLQSTGYFQREYESLRLEYESLRYTFNLEKNMNNLWIEKSFTSVNRHHICEKPIGLIEKMIRVSSNPGDVVLDSFGGSGTTAVACENLNRKYILFEMEEKYCTIAERRINEAKQNLFHKTL